MKKLILVHLLNDYSGSPKVLSQVFQACQNGRYEVELYTGRSKNGFLSNLTSKHRFFFYKRFENKYLTLVFFIASQVILLFKLLRLRGQDAIFYINTMLPFGAALAGKLMGKPVYYHVHETTLTPPVLKRFLRFIVQKTATKVIFVSKSVQESESFAGKEQSAIYNALSDDYVQASASDCYQRRNDGKFNVLMICSLKDYKGINEFIEIARQCEQQSKVSFTLVLNAEQSEIDQHFANTTMPSNTILHPRQANPIPFYQKASLVLNLSRVDEWVETFGLTIIEAMAFGIPVIVPPVGGPVEIVTEGVEGYLISSYEKEQIADRILKLSADEELCLNLSRNAKKRSKDFMPEVFEKEILRVIGD